MDRFFYVDESGFNGDYVFVAVSVQSPLVPKKKIKNWRSWMKNRITGFNQNEYHDYNASDIEKRKILSEIKKHKDLKFWAVIKSGYNCNHKDLYVPVITNLFRYCEVTERDTIIALDEVDTRSYRMENYIRKIKRNLQMPELNINFVKSEKEKGIQIADAIAGAVSKEYIRKTTSYFEYISSQLQKEVKML